jgi:hypothetical protein
MASSAPHIVLLSVNDGERNTFNDRVVAASTLPGSLVEVASTGKLAKIAAAAKPNSKIFVLENPYAADDTLMVLDQPYATDDGCFYIYAQTGDVVYAILTASQVVAIGDPIVSTVTGGAVGKGTLDATVVTGALIGYAEEAVTTTGATGRIKVRIA